MIRETVPFQHYPGTHIDGLVKDCGVSSALATAILQFSSEPSTCQTWDLYGKHVNQLNVEWNKAVRRTLNLPYKTHRRLLPLIVNGKSFKSQHCSRLHKYVNGFFSSENIYVSFIGAKAKTRVTGSLGRNWARLAVMDGLVPFDPPDEHTSAHAGMIKELLDMRDGINECLHLSRTEIDDLIYHLCCEW